MSIITRHNTAAAPAIVQIEPVGQCNLRCRMCSSPYRSEASGGRPAFIETGFFEKLVDQVAGAGEIHLQGLGEPLMHPAFFSMVSYAVSRGFTVTTNSNMTLLDEVSAEECVRSGLAWIRISIDGVTPETYESIRVGSSLALVLANIELLAAARQRLKSETPRLFLVMVLMKSNITELKEIIRLAHRHSIEEVFVQHLCHDFSEEGLPVRYRPLRDFVEKETLLFEDPDRIGPLFREALTVASGLGIQLRLPAIAGNRRSEDGNIRRCDLPWRSAYICYDGTAMPCCMIGTPDRLSLGNMARDGFASIWNGEAYRDFRSQLASDDPPSVCRACSLFRGIF